MDIFKFQNNTEKVKNTNKFGMQITNTPKLWKDLSEIYNIDPYEIMQIDLNRSGIYLPDNEVREDYRVRFSAKIRNNYESWFALPVRNNEDTNFNAFNNKLYFGKVEIGQTGELVLDTCESSYQRGPSLLNLNSRSRSNCGGCKACVHHHKKLYDETVIKDNISLTSLEDIENFFNNKKIDPSKLNQIAVVTGLFGGEEKVVDHMNLINNFAQDKGFTGELMYFGCEINSKKALDSLSKINNFAIVYAIDNFTRRDHLLAKTKSNITIDTANQTLLEAKERNIRTSISYISGIDSIQDMCNGFNQLKDSLTSFPIINIYQVQTLGQSMVFNKEATSLEYYVKSRTHLEDIFSDSDLRPRRWENYRPLWYKYFGHEELPSNSYGEKEKISQYSKFGRNINIADIVVAVRNKKQNG